LCEGNPKGIDWLDSEIVEGGKSMATYLMFGSYSVDSIGKISARRTERATALIEENGGKVLSGYAMLGEKDLVLIVDFPGTAEAMKTSVALAKLLDVSFTTSPAVSFDEFDKLLG
jgi:uncharacterized protein with GYD domain